MSQFDLDKAITKKELKAMGHSAPYSPDFDLERQPEQSNPIEPVHIPGKHLETPTKPENPLFD